MNLERFIINIKKILKVTKSVISAIYLWVLSPLIRKILIVITIAFGYQGLHSYFKFESIFPPDAHEWPLLFAPALTLATGFLTCGEQIYYIVKNKIDDTRIVTLNGIAIFLILFSCLFLSNYHGPLLHIVHIAIVLVLFLFFIIWDRKMIKWLKKVPDGSALSEKIRIANCLINWPTFLGFWLVLIVVLFHTCCKSHPLINKVQQILNEVQNNCNNELRTQDIHELISYEAGFFVSGAIAFHLAIVAGAYFFTSHFLKINHEDERKR